MTPHLIVRREHGLFVLLDPFRVVVKTMDAQMIVDYCNATFPKGTQIHWQIQA